MIRGPLRSRKGLAKTGLISEASVVGLMLVVISKSCTPSFQDRAGLRMDLHGAEFVEKL